MKIKKVIFISLIFQLFFISCEKGDSYSVITNGRIDVNETEFISMRLEPESGFIDSPVKLIIENHTQEDWIYGHDFSLEYFKNGKWKKIQFDFYFPAIGIILAAGETTEGLFNLSLIEEYNNGKKGKYRYVKSTGLYVEFEIK